jgi:hypothetical protein
MVPTECQHKTTFKSCFVKVKDNIINKLCFSALEYSYWVLNIKKTFVQVHIYLEYPLR